MKTTLKRITVSMTPEMHTTISKISSRNHQSLSNCVISLATKALEEHKSGQNPFRPEVDLLHNIQSIQLRNERKMTVLGEIVMQYIRMWFIRNPEPANKDLLPQAKRRERQFIDVVASQMEESRHVFTEITHQIKEDIDLIIKSIQDDLSRLPGLIPNEEGKEIVQRLQLKLEELIPLLG